MDGVLCPIVMNLFYGCGAWGEKKVTDQSAHAVDEATPSFRRLRFSNITARRIKFAAAFILGLPEMLVEDLIIENSSFFLDSENRTAGVPAMAPGVPQLCRAAYRCAMSRSSPWANLDISDQLGPAISVNDARFLSWPI